MQSLHGSIFYSFVIPIFNEERLLPTLMQRMRDVVARIDGQCEVIYVNDGSSDSSGKVLAREAAQQSFVRVIEFSRNFGHQAAIVAGMQQALGRAVITLDGDLQDPPEVALEFIEKWQQGADVVYGVRRRRSGESLFKRSTAYLFYRIMNWLSDVEIPTDVGDFRLIDRAVLNVLNQFPEKQRYVRGLVAWVGFNQVAVPYDRDRRFEGKTKYTLGKMLHLAIRGMTGFSIRPLRLVLALGIGMAAVTFALALFAIGLKVSGAYTVRGWTSIVLGFCMIASVQFIVLGFIGEYVGQAFTEIKGRPIFIIKDPTDLQVFESGQTRRILRPVSEGESKSRRFVES